MIMVILLGMERVLTGPIQFAPVIDFGIYSITTIRPGVSPEKMEVSVTVPLEQELLEVDGVKQMISNTVEGLSIIQVNADPSADKAQLAKIYGDLQRAIDRAVARLPDDLIEKPELRSITNEDMPLLRILISGNIDEELLRKVAKKLQNQLREMPDITTVDLESYRDREVRLLLDPLKLNQLGVSFEEIEKAIRNRNVSDTGGAFDSFVGEQDVMALGEFDDPKEVQDVILRASGFGDFLRIRDIANVVMDYEAPRVLHSINGRSGIMMNLKADSNNNEMKLGEAVEKVLDSARSDLPRGVHLDVVYERYNTTRSTLNVLLDNALIGALLIAMALILFFPWRATFWVIMGLPTAILLALVLFPVAGVTPDNTSLFAIVMMLGLLVDDAIVISESIYRYHEQGYDPRTSALRGTLDVAKPVFVGALTTLLAFTPLLLVEGLDSKFLWVVPVTVILVITASLLECNFLLPSHLAKSLHHSKGAKNKARWFLKVENTYRSFLQSATQYPRRWLVVVVIAFAVFTTLVSAFMKFESYPVTDSSTIVVLVELPTGSSLEKTAAALQDIEQKVNLAVSSEHIKNMYSVAGHHDSGRLDFVIEGQHSSWGKVMIELVPGGEREVRAPVIAQQIQARLDPMQAEFERLSAIVTLETPPTGFPVEIQVIGAGDERGQIADELLAYLHADPDVTEAWSNYKPGKSIISLDLDHEKMAAYGLQVASVTKAIKVAFDGYIVDELQTLNERIRFRLQLQQEHRGDVSAFRSLLIQNNRGEQIPLRSIASFEVLPGQESILHYAGSRTETVYGNINRNTSSVTEVNERAMAFITESEFGKRYPAARVKIQGEYMSQQATSDTMGMALLLILVGILFLMILLFDSLVQPLLVMLVIPFAFVSVMFVFLLQGTTISVPALVGFMGLAGVLINSSLVMIDQINRLHQQSIEQGIQQQGSSISRDSIIEGSVYRLRPIVLTAMTTAAGLGPAAYGWAGVHFSLTSMIMVMFWGVVVGAVITLVTLPVFLAFVSDTQTRWKQFRG